MRLRDTTTTLRLEPLEDRTLLSVDLVRDILPGVQSSFPLDMVAFGDHAFFTAAAGPRLPHTLWKSDGTDSGTTEVFRLGAVQSPTVVGSSLYFSVDGGQLWRSDGTPDGSSLVYDLSRETQCPRIPEILAVGDAVLFTFWDQFDYGRCPGKLSSSELFLSDGTTAGTVSLLRRGSEQPIGNLMLVGAQVFFTIRDELWITDGTAEGTRTIYRFAPGGSAYDFVPVGDALFFTANDGENGRELWRSDGTAEGTQMVLDLRPGPLGAFDANVAYSFLRELNGEVFFTANDGETGFELYKSDGTPEGTALVADIQFGPGSSAPRNLTNVSGWLYFTADDGFFGRELWATYGTSETTYLVRDINPDGDAFPASQFTNLSLADVAGLLHFVANDGQTGWELYVSDGTEKATYQVRDIVEGPGSALDPRMVRPFLTDVNGRLFFAANDLEHGTELWASVGRGAGAGDAADVVAGLLSLESPRLKRLAT